MEGKERIQRLVAKQFANQIADTMTATSGFIGDLTGDVTGDLTGNVTGNVTGDVTGAVTGNVTGGVVLPTPTAYTGADAPNKAISPALFWAVLTKATAGTDYTLSAPGAGNVGHTLRVTSTTAAAHVVTVTGLVGGTTMTFAGAIGDGFEVFAMSSTAWVVASNNGVTQTA